MSPFREVSLFDTIVIGGGIAGMATAARLQARGLSTIVLESHATIGGCAGYFTRAGFSFDVGATTLVDFQPEGIGGELLRSIGMPALSADPLPGYRAWLPDRVVTLYRDRRRWCDERRTVLGSSVRHRRFWKLLDDLSSAFWRASGNGIRLPMRNWRDVRDNLHAIRPRDLLLTRYLRRTMGQILERFSLRQERALVALLSMLIEDTVHSSVDEAPAINASLGVTIRGAGLTRVAGGMAGFWHEFGAHYSDLGGRVELGCRVVSLSGRRGDFRVRTRRGEFRARTVVSAIPIALTADLGLDELTRALVPFVERDASQQGGAVVVFLGVPEREVGDTEWTHHQILERYDAPLGDGNNMFISVSAADDLASAPAGHRTVVLSTHTDLAAWRLDGAEYLAKKNALAERMIRLARRVYPSLGQSAVVRETGTPKTYARFTRRPRGAVGGVKLGLSNSNQNAVPHDIGVPGLRLVGDTTWPGLGTVACVLGSRIVADDLWEELGSPARSPSVRRERVTVR
ncbi:MAG: FAD-dependent oxidoreductase [Planctomycetes bacterium]|nr:FAD-dependent oxidoreductase [Planctomycetota bacterium]